MIATAVRAREAVLVDSCPTNGSGMATSRCDAHAGRTESGVELPDAHLPADSENTPELMAIIERQKARRRPDCPFIFHGRTCGTARLDQQGNRRSCLGDFQKVWNRAGEAIGMRTRIPHDLDAPPRPHHRARRPSPRREAGEQVPGPKDNVVRPDFGRTRTEPAEDDVVPRPVGPWLS